MSAATEPETSNICYGGLLCLLLSQFPLASWAQIQIDLLDELLAKLLELHLVIVLEMENNI